jgi:hypothetical protein
MTKIGMYVNTESKSHSKKRGSFESQHTLECLYASALDNSNINDLLECLCKILDADYSAIDITEHINSLEHLNDTQKFKLQKVLKSHATEFQWGLGTLKIKPVHLELVSGTTPYHAQAIPIPQSLEKLTKTEMERLT